MPDSLERHVMAAEAELERVTAASLSVPFGRESASKVVAAATIIRPLTRESAPRPIPAGRGARDEGLHVQVGDCSGDQRSKVTLPMAAYLIHRSGIAFMAGSQLGTHRTARIGFWVHSPLGHRIFAGQSPEISRDRRR